MSEDILKVISDEDLPNLRDLYSKHMPYATHIYSTINTAIKWKKMRPDKNYFTFYAPNGDWSDGTFIALLQWSCYDLMVFTLDPQCERLYKGLKETKRIDWMGREVVFYALHGNHYEIVTKVINEKKIPLLFETKTDYWWIPKEKAAKFESSCPEGFYIDTLQPQHASIVNNLWPIKHEGSLDYVKTFIEMNGGHGVFRKSDGKLVSWVLKCHMGTLALLQTDEEFKRKGFAKEVTKSLSKEIALEGHNPLGTVLVDNSASQSMFQSLGFEILGWNKFLLVGLGEHRRDIV